MKRYNEMRALAFAAGLFGVAVLPLTAYAHHGWSWTESEESRLSGEIAELSLGNPHAHLQIVNEEGTWEVDLAPPYATSRSGFVEGVAQVGDSASFTGHRSSDPGELRFKAETITVNGKTYDVYPRREKSLKPQA